MPVDVPAPTQVLTLVFAAWALGTAAGGAISRQWKEIQGGHFKVVWLVVAGLSLAAGFGYRPWWLVTVLALGTFGAIYRQFDRGMAVATAAMSVAVLLFEGPFYAFASAALLGAVTNAMLLGHWHLNQPRLGTKPIVRLVVGLWGAIGVYLVATALLLLANTTTGLRVIAAVTALAFTVFAGVLTALVQHLVRTRSIMSATGILYLEILLVFVAAFTGSLAVLAVK